MRSHVCFWISLYVAFMIGYFLLLAVFLPSTVAYEPSWIKVGSFAEYSVDDWGSGDKPVMNGTYAWRVMAIENLDGGKIVTINETFEGTTHWDHVAIIPPGGRTTKINAAGVTADGLILWLGRHYNRILPYRTFFLGIPRYVWVGGGGGEMSFRGQTRYMLHLEALEELRTADYDQATGVFVGYRWTWPRLGTVYVTLKSTNVFSSVNVTSTQDILRSVLDLLLVVPLFVLPLGAIIGLSSIRRRGISFSPLFWLGFTFLNGTFIALLSNWPFRIPASLELPLFLLVSQLNVGFWTGTLGAAILVVDGFMFPIITKK